jgi:hypothetical protein
MNNCIKSNHIEILTEVRFLNNSVKSKKKCQCSNVPFLEGTFPKVNLTSTKNINKLSKLQLIEVLSRYGVELQENMTRPHLFLS